VLERDRHVVPASGPAARHLVKPRPRAFALRSRVPPAAMRAAATRRRRAGPRGRSAAFAAATVRGRSARRGRTFEAAGSVLETGQGHTSNRSSEARSGASSHSQKRSTMPHDDGEGRTSRTRVTSSDRHRGPRLADPVGDADGAAPECECTRCRPGQGDRAPVRTTDVTGARQGGRAVDTSGSRPCGRGHPSEVFRPRLSV
jgi:hypothetical protein